MPSGGARPGAGRPPGSGDPLKHLFREESAAMREARERLVEKIAGTRADPLYGLVEIASDLTIPPGIRVAAYRTYLPYVRAPITGESRIEHSHLHTAVTMDEMNRALLRALGRLRDDAAIEGSAEPQPALLGEPEPEPAE